jgi:microsomal dipeptidase-like Zn-dependent dipeptidase
VLRLAIPAGLVCVLLAVLASAAPAASVSGGQGGQDRYSIVHGCYALKSNSLGKLVQKGSGGYTAGASDVGSAEPLRFQATTLGKYLLYGKNADYLAAPGGGVLDGDRATSASGASPAAEWTVDGGQGAFTLTATSSGKKLSVAPNGDVTVGGDASQFSLVPAQGCAVYPEADVNATGTPGGGSTPYGEARGLVDAHMHGMAFEFIGGSIHCGRPWHPYGVQYAMVDCPDHGPGGVGAAAEGVVSYGTPTHPHDTVGWPTFKDWPKHDSLTHEGFYYKGLERAWRGGLRLLTNLLVDNRALCEVYPIKRNPCNEMNTVLLEMRDLRELEAYVDAQEGGPGKGWFRIVKDPYEARRVINQGKLAIVPGMEVSEPFGCITQNDVPQCDRKGIVDWLNKLQAMGVSQLELTNKFDNALTGVAGDSGSTGLITSGGNKFETGNFFDYRKCQDENSDRVPATQAPEHNTDSLVTLYQMFGPSGQLPVYGEGDQCNVRGLTDLGDFAIREMVKRHMIMDPDHMSVLGRRQALSLTEALHYSGVMSSHSWSTNDAYPRIYRDGGFITPYAGESTSFVKAWQYLNKIRDKRYRYGLGYGADMNGLGHQGSPRGENAPNKVTYPFKSFDGKVTLDKAHWGQRVWDINTDGVSMYGLYPDWVQDLRNLAGPQIVKDMAMGAEAYLDTWERAQGIKGPGCRSAHEGFAAAGDQLGRVKLGATTVGVLRGANQPVSRFGRVYRWCVGDKGDRKGNIAAVFTTKERVGIVTSTAPKHRWNGIGTGSPSRLLRGRTSSIGPGLYATKLKGGTRILYGAKKGKVTFVALVTRAIAGDRTELLRELKLAGLR